MRGLLATLALSLLLAAPAAGGGAGGLIAFERRSGTGVADLYTVRPDGTGLRRLTRDAQSFDPAWSPDGRMIAFASSRGGRVGAPELYVMDADGRYVRRLTRNPGAPERWAAASAPAWSPDGRQLVFVRLQVAGDTALTDLWSIGVGGRGLRRLTSGRGEEAAPAWSPEGLLAYELDGSLVLQRPGRPAERIGRGGEPQWSPAGDRLAFVRDGFVSIVGADGTRLRRLVRGSSPSWSPDAARIVYSGEDGLFSIRPDGSGRRRVTRTPPLRHDLSPSWRLSR